MATFAQPGLNLAELVASVPMSALAARNPYSAFGYALNAAPFQPSATDSGWRTALDAQLLPQQGQPSRRGIESGDTSSANSGDPFTRLFGTQIGKVAANIVGNESQTLGQFGIVAAETLAAAMTLIPTEGSRTREFWAEEETRTLVLPGDPESGKPPTVLHLALSSPLALKIISASASLAAALIIYGRDNRYGGVEHRPRNLRCFSHERNSAGALLASV